MKRLIGAGILVGGLGVGCQGAKDVVSESAEGAETTASAASPLVGGCEALPLVASGYVAWWKFDEGSGDIANDASGFGNTGTLGGGTATKKPVWTSGKFGGALEFDGVDDMVAAGHGASLNIEGPITMEAWIRPSATAASSKIISRGGPAIYPYELGFKRPSGSNPNTPFWSFGFTTTGFMYKYLDQTVVPEQWAHVAVVYDRTNVTTYINGVAATPVFAINEPLQNAGTRDLYIGSRYNGLYPFKGAIDEVRLYNRALSPSEVANNFASASEIVVKATDTGFSTSSTWSNFPGGYSGAIKYKTVQSASVPQTTATWTYNVAETGDYKVYAIWPSHTNRAKDAPFTIQHSTGATTVRVDQQQNSLEWVRLGLFHLNAGANSVSLSNDATANSPTSTTVVVADAIKVVRARPLATMPIVTSPVAAYSVQRLAEEGADYLERITCTTHPTAVGDGSSGIALGTASDFPALNLASHFDPSDRFRLDEILLQGHSNGVYVVGANEGATDQAWWEFLYQLGYRHYLAGPNWEVFPYVANLSAATAALNLASNPDYKYRTFTYDHAFGGDLEFSQFGQWTRHNRLNSNLTIKTNQGFGGGAVHQNMGVWAPPDPTYSSDLASYLNSNSSGLCHGPGTTVNLNLCNPDVRQLIANYAVEYFNHNPQVASISMEPPDDFMTCDGAAGCEDATKPLYGSPSNQVVALANKVASELVAAGHTTKLVGINAYKLHYAPPTIAIHPNVWVKIQTNFDGVAGISTETAIAGWKAQMAPQSAHQWSLGKYYSTWAWYHSMPGQAPGADLLGIKDDYANDPGAQGLLAVVAGEWLDGGLGYYLSGRMSLETASSFDAKVDDFFARSFGPAQAPARAFFDELYRMNATDPDIEHFIMSEDLVARLYGWAAQARTAAAGSAPIDPGVSARIDDLILYARYVELRVKYLSTPGSTANSTNRQAAFENLLRFVYRIRDRMLVNSYILWTKLAGIDSHGHQLVHVPLTAGSSDTFTQWDVPEQDDPLKDSTPFTRQELDALLAAGPVNNHTVDALMTPVPYANDIVPAGSLNRRHVPDTDSTNESGQYVVEHYVWVPTTTLGGFDLDVGLVAYTENQVKLELFSIDANGARTREDGRSLFPVRLKADAVRLHTTKAGRHILKVDSTKKQLYVSMPDDVQHVLKASFTDYYLPRQGSPWSAYFYVPAGATQIGGYSLDNTEGRILDPDGAVALDFQNLYWQTGDAGFFNIPVPSGQAGKFWKFDDCSEARVLLTVPPWLTRDDGQSLLPSQVVATDAAAPNTWSVNYSKDLVRATPLGLPTAPAGTLSRARFSEAHGRSAYYTWLDEAGAVTFNVNTEAANAPADTTLSVTLSAVDANGQETDAKTATQDFATGAPLTFAPTLTASTSGLHKVVASSPATGRRVLATITSIADLKMAIPQGPQSGWEFDSSWTLYFYVPKGTTVVGGYYRSETGSPGPVSGTLRDGSGNTVQLRDQFGAAVPNRNTEEAGSDFGDFLNPSDPSTGAAGYFQAEVLPGQDGKLWKFTSNTGQRVLMTVPPYLARSPNELLLPREVVEADTP